MKPQCNITQPFGANATITYVKGGLKGHTGVDSSCGFGSPIQALWGNEYVYKVLTKDSPSNDGTGFTGVFTIIDNGTECFEFLYGHCNPSVKIGDILQKGQVLGTEANNGEVYFGNERITLDMQKNGDIRGHHRHDQARKLKKDVFIQPNTSYLDKVGGGKLFLNGGYFAIPDYFNGYNGCYNWVTDTQPVAPVKPAPVDTPFITYQKAKLAYQVSKGITDFVGAPLDIIKEGPKTITAMRKDGYKK